MASKVTKRSICLLTFALFSVVHSFMDIEELQSINYGINILKEPIVIPEVSFSSAFYDLRLEVIPNDDVPNFEFTPLITSYRLVLHIRYVAGI